MDNPSSTVSHLSYCQLGYIVTSPKEKGGLGISKLKTTNHVLLCKWLWWYLRHGGKLIISAKYTTSVVGDFPLSRKHYSQKAPWMSIIKNKSWFESNFKWQISNEEGISFWHGRWNEKSPLLISYPGLFALSNSNDIYVN